MCFESIGTIPSNIFLLAMVTMPTAGHIMFFLSADVHNWLGRRVVNLACMSHNYLLMYCMMDGDEKCMFSI